MLAADGCTLKLTGAGQRSRTEATPISVRSDAGLAAADSQAKRLGGAILQEILLHADARGNEPERAVQCLGSSIAAEHVEATLSNPRLLAMTSNSCSAARP